MNTIFFAVIDILDKMSGIELAALSRSKLFKDYLDLNPVLLTIGYNRHLHQNLYNAKQISRAASNLSVLNIYDYFQETTQIDFLNNNIQRDNFDAFRVVPVPNSPDLRFYDEDGNFIAHCVRTENLALQYINYIQNGYIYRRENYDCRGFLSRIDILEKKSDDEEAVNEFYLRADGSVVIIKRGLIKNNVLQEPYLINIIDRQGQLLKMFHNDKEFIAYWLGLVVKEFPTAVFMIDRVAEFFDSLKKIKYSGYGDIKLIPVVHNVHTANDPLVGDASPFYKSIVEDKKSSDAIVVLTEKQKNDFHVRYGHENIVVIPNHYDVVTETPPFSSRNKHKILYLARFADEKNHNLAVDIFRKVVDKVPEAELHCYGFGNKKDEVIAQVASLNLKDNVFINDYVQDIGLLYKNAGLSILTSRVEGFPLGVIESLSYGCPVISHDINYGPSAMIQNGINGFLIPYANTTEFANCLVEILNNPSLHEHLVNNAAASTLPFTSREVSKQWKHLLDSHTTDNL